MCVPSVSMTIPLAWAAARARDLMASRSSLDRVVVMDITLRTADKPARSSRSAA